MVAIRCVSWKRGFQAVLNMRQMDVVAEMKASGLVNDAPNSLTKLENDAVQVEKKGTIANVTNRSFQNVTSL